MTLTLETTDLVSQIEFRDDMRVELVRSQAQDSDVVWAARVSTAGDRSLEELDRDPKQSAGLINYLAKNRHGTPFEHNSMTFFISAPIFVFREFQRHRIGFSYNEASGRYSVMEPAFYVPARDRNLVQQGKTGHYEFVAGSDEQYEAVVEATKHSCIEAVKSYDAMLSAGVAREVARGVWPVCGYSSMFTTCNARSLMSLLSLRTKHEDSKFPSYPQREIEMVAEKMEEHFAQLMPITYASFVANGRVAP